MIIETTVKLTQDQLNKYVLDGLKADGKPLPDGVVLTVIVLPPSQAVATAPGNIASAAPIGQTVNGFKITHYGYPGDSSPDSGSMKGIGDRGNKLVPGLSVALTKSARQRLFGKESPSTGSKFTLSGQKQEEYQDDDSAPEDDLRIDVYDPFYTGTDPGCTPEMFAKSKGEMVAAGILQA